MKTRIIQDEPDARQDRLPPSQKLEHRRPHGALERPSPQDGHLRLARARDRPVRDQHGRPEKQIVFETSGPGESGRMDKILYEDFRQPAGEAVLVQSRR